MNWIETGDNEDFFFSPMTPFPPVQKDYKTSVRPGTACR